LRDPLPYISIG